jgi:TPR repeat protein
MNAKFLTALLTLCLVTPSAYLFADDDDAVDAHAFLSGPGLKQMSEDEYEDFRRKVNDGVEPDDFDFPRAPADTEESPEKKIVTVDDWKALNEKAKQGDAESLYVIGLCFAKGHKVPQDLSKASRFFLSAGQKGHAQAQLLCARCLELNHGVGPGEEQAARTIISQFYGFAALKGLTAANYHYAHYRKYSLAKKSDDPKSIASHFRLAAEKGHAAAQYELALCYREGAGVSKLRLLSHKLLRVSAEQGFAKAQYELGLCYASGNYRVPKNPVEAYAWIATAVSNGLSDDAWALANLKNQLTPPELESARKLAIEYTTKFKAPPKSANPLL